MTDISASLGQLGISEEQVDLLHVATEFCRDKSPVEDVRKLIETDRGYDEKVWSEIAELGWLGIAVPEEFGGSGLGVGEIVPIAEQMGRALMATPFIPATVAGQLLAKAGTERQKEEVLPALAAGERFATTAFGEPGDDMAALGENEAGGFLVSGTTRLVEYAADADLIILAFSHGGSRQLALVERSALPGEALRREAIIDDTRRAYELRLDTFEVAGDAVLDPDKVEEALAHADMVGALLYAADMVGGTFRVVDYTADYLRTRKQFEKVIGSFQALKHPLVDAFIGHERARSHLYAAAHSFGDQGRGEVAVRMAKAQGEKAYAYAADRAIQFHGGFGFTYDCDAGLHRRRAIWNATRYGDARAQKRRLAELLF
ncbi:acyl-CoA dehydrogenase [Pacificimonas flava]|uniref:Acyl-CoA dehydrogenase n=2 Tax=Pacificimonas TaxID=1960290 RepID=A0A219B3R6_9SPHN|nr:MULTISPECIES: acyl-CoA dehydrogenase family protein [Pacificimonas]MBZ6377294.1 acyl-CoA/acyl-ACP dehydrogenase [Pacificimonas aurantium]OWV32995.1 acyl-CoA dehydrogenase [Pacificimonas flava]